ncbi:MAG TPA: complex I NDUFA9 subunit family protein [Gemmatimonadaceae bacterium]|nr:complex I NDUFA9 subunit family protein [Gemmatimonadaceae bacterium]
MSGFSAAEGTASAAAVAEQPQSSGTHRALPVLVTGAAGFVGAHTCRMLVDCGWRVRAFVHHTARAARRLPGTRVEIVQGDVRDAGAVASAVRGVGAVVHLAAIAIERGGNTYEGVNTRGTEVVLAAATEAGVRRVVHMSQNGASATSPYRFLRSKGLAEDAVRASRTDWTVLRPSVIFGPEDEFVSVLARLVRLSPFVYPLPGGGRTRFQPVAVEDVARAICDALDRPSTIHAVLPLGGPAALTLRQMTERVLLAMDTSRVLVGVPVWLLRPVVAIAQRLLPSPPVTTSLLDLLAVQNTVEPNALVDELGITPTPFAPEEIRYLARITVGGALRSLFR